eukprot:GHRQ01003172.1.p1 GENE.GHRQ01003172.1~~GHRQ01003172.1.p1  ORF type:complete len:221 (+),score=53.56 GHRQ01003172.1:228-890(+)
MATGMRICLALLLAAYMSHAAVPPAVYDKTLIVEDLAKCPVKNVPFDKKDFDVTQLVSLANVLEASNATQKCKDEATEKLISCYVDSDTMSSLAIMTGCCSKACATALEDSVKSGCFAQYVEIICQDPESRSMELGLSHTAKRCANYEAECSAPPAKAANTTVPAKTADATAAPTRGTEPAAAPAPAASPAAKSNSAVSAAAATCVSFVMAAGALVLAMH